MKVFITILSLGVFLVYSQSMLVMWCLYFIEKHDIILYYCPSDANSGGDGSSYIHKLCDAAKGEHTGAMVLLKIVEKQKNYSGVRVIVSQLPQYSFSLPTNEQPSHLFSAYDLSVFRPPRS